MRGSVSWGAAAATGDVGLLGGYAPHVLPFGLVVGDTESRSSFIGLVHTFERLSG
ncbi:MAG: hypothetical protein ACJASD_001098 [Sphingomonas echinoides]|jgi:hypothetical protein|uniref:hypothetical protein n=1 Tax=Sphingomonas sp. PL20 TaxID=2760712 RepID=UPI001AE3EBB4